MQLKYNRGAKITLNGFQTNLFFSHFIHIEFNLEGSGPSMN